ncbi:MAG: phosphoribosyltransferase [Chthoniobacterales bacterium]
MKMHFQDRDEAGALLARELKDYAKRDDVIVLALPRGGVPVGARIAEALQVPLDVFVVRKLGVPGHEELAMGAIATGGVRVMNRDVVGSLRVPANVFEEVAACEREELERREREYRDDLPPPNVDGKTVILVDDGIATGSTMLAAIRALRDLNVGEIIVAAPVAPDSTAAEIERTADKVVVLLVAEYFYGVGGFYEDFSQTSDDEVRELLAKGRQREAAIAA